MLLYCKVGSLPGKHYKVFCDPREARMLAHRGKPLRRAPVVGSFFMVREPTERYARLEPVRLLEIRDVGQPLYICERF